MTDQAQAVELLERASDILIETHPSSMLLREQLDSGELERRLKVIGKAFDPTGRVALLLDIQRCAQAIRQPEARTQEQP